ncbi:helix-turn-helix transcriptional regulator [Pseudomonas chlororaphis]|uniref:helix-turn-helix transcriptional regulator n=1 Tax=Pseudomonas chlororaphis TaxID=587753 RepID=UPI000F562619|nr:helix-turn-helix transcriptional regulator [Pseudomonas chlororaphis]MBP5054949.1 helix-turn-helix transcriptional regulator [Pseudomonas chlororaphis]MBP5139253.1 helix-turn-helix transcriptional regulator [Pseudomonas chlororaphis]QTT98668.1 helix-turn-helix transcriptional regulator [Pseudomonas chlororaphis]WDG45760.1 helix-turn-helix transcriptional regulator [Pseudomonas chlororaphis]
MNHIASLRKGAGIKQTDLRQVLGWTQARLSNYESGHRTPGLSECRAITAALNRLGAKCTLDDVFPPDVDLQQAA